ncbi:Uncharacterized conserved protein, contains FIST_N domain [Lachnospiraceae bacterium XBB1006]|nr:Uncharacterized conserved protein, contains FIST_N domain [Lachnospiraceae bacterium XBB1006]
MQVTVGYSKKNEALDAVKEATEKINHAEGILFQSPFGMLKEVATLLHEKYPNVPLIGTGATTYFGKEASDKVLVIVAFVGGCKIKSGVICNLSTAPLHDIMPLKKAVSELGAKGDSAVCLEYCTNDEERLVSTMNVELLKDDVAIAGGSVFGTPAGQKPCVCVDGELYEDACCWLLIKSTTGKIRTYTERIYEIPEQATMHVATKVDLKTKDLIMLDNRPAAEVYANELGISKNQIVDNVFKNPLGRIVGDDVYIISQYEVGANGSMRSYKRVCENDTICFLELQDYASINDETCKRIKAENKSVSLVFTINCIYRHLFFEKEKYLPTLLDNMGKLGTHVGVVGGGEQYRKQHVNQTMVCVVFE